MEEETKVPFTKNEAQVLLQLLDIAVKSGGIQVAEAAVVLFKKFEKVVTPPPQAPTVESKA